MQHINSQTKSVHIEQNHEIQCDFRIIDDNFDIGDIFADYKEEKNHVKRFKRHF